MAKKLQLRRGTTAQHGSFTGDVGECTVDTDKDTLVVHDNSTAGGRPLLREDLNNLANDSVTYGHLQNVAANSILGNNTGSAADAIELTAAQVRTFLNVEDDADANVATDLSVTTTATTNEIASSTGTNATLNEATSSAAGLMSTTHHDKLDGIASGAEVNVATNLGQTTGANSLTITSSTGDNVTIAEASSSVAGLMSTAHHDKLDGIATSANNYSHPNHSGDVTSTGDGATVIANDAVTYAKMQNLGTANRVLGGTAAGNISEVQVEAAMIADEAVTEPKLATDAAGSTGQFLQKSGATTMTWATVSTQAFPSGTVMLFRQTAAPTGWTKDTSNNNGAAIRVVTGSVSTGGSNTFTTVFGSSISTASHTLTTSEIPSHTHTATVTDPGHTHGKGATLSGGTQFCCNGSGTATTSNTQSATTGISVSNASTGGGGGHSHSMTMDLMHIDVIVATHD